MIRLGLGLTDRVRYWIERKKRKKKKVRKGGGTQQKEQGQSYFCTYHFFFFLGSGICSSEFPGLRGTRREWMKIIQSRGETIRSALEGSQPKRGIDFPEVWLV